MPVPPLNPHVRIVDESGRPTPEFIRWWQSQRDENTGIPDLSDPGTVSGALDSIGDERGQILYRGETEWLPLAPGTVNYVLTSAGTGADPAWAAAVRAFLDLSDTPADYTGQAGRTVKVNGAENGLEFGDLASNSITLSTETSDFSVTNTHLSGFQYVACDFTVDGDVTIPSGLTGTEPARFLSVGPGRPSFVPASGVTMLALNDNGLMLGPGAQATLIPLGADEYLLWGDIGSDALLLLSGDESGYVLLSGDANSGTSRLELSGV